MNIAIIIRGIPGSGKSTLSKMVKLLCEKNGFSCNIHNTDEYFMENGKYNFSFEKLGIFHKQNYSSFKESIINNTNVVICDNTNIKAKDYKKYAICASQNNYKVITVLFIPDIEENHIKRNTHSVPPETISKMIHKLNNSLECDHCDKFIKFNPTHSYLSFDKRISILANDILSENVHL